MNLPDYYGTFDQPKNGGYEEGIKEYRAGIDAFNTCILKIIAKVNGVLEQDIDVNSIIDTFGINDLRVVENSSSLAEQVVLEMEKDIIFEPFPGLKEKMVSALDARFRVGGAVGDLKDNFRKPKLDEERKALMIQSVISQGEQYNIYDGFIERVWTKIHDLTVGLEENND